MACAGHAILILGLAANGSLAAAAPADSVLNERPPVTRAEREKHWGVNCNAVIARLAGLGKQNAHQAEEWLSHREEIRLCAQLDRMQAREGLPFLRVSAALDSLVACLQVRPMDCNGQLVVLRELLVSLDLNQGE